MIRILTSAVFAVLVTVFALPATAQSLAVLDTQRILTQSNAAQRAQEVLGEKKEKGQSRINKMEQDIKTKRSELQRKQSILTEDKVLEEQDELKKMMRNYRAEVQSIQDGLDRELTLRRKEIIVTLNQVVSELAKKREFDLVLPKNVLLYGGENVDITEDVLAMVNKRLDN